MASLSLLFSEAELGLGYSGSQISRLLVRVQALSAGKYSQTCYGYRSTPYMATMMSNGESSLQSVL